MTAQRSVKLLEIVAEYGTVFPQRFLQLVSQRFRPLQAMLHCAMFSCDLSRDGVARQVV